MTCATFTVPLDRGLAVESTVPGALTLSVAMTDNAGAPRGNLVWLVGGPGEPGSMMADDIARQFDPAVLREYQLVLFSGRGTGSTALWCPSLQQAMGSADLTVPPVQAVADCANTVGDSRRFYDTTSTVEDLDGLRRALGADKLTLDSASYGTYLAERYAIAHPDRVSRLVLDGVQPSDGYDYMLNVAVMRSVAPVLWTVCQRTGCGTDPVADLASVVAGRHNGPELLDVLVSRTSGSPRLADLPGALHQAATGHPAQLDAVLADAARDRHTSASELSQGLHATTQCQDQPGPWGDISSAVASRSQTLAAAVAALPEPTFYPFDRATALGNGVVVTCLVWPSTAIAPAAASAVHAVLPRVPTLLLAGELDLITPVVLAEHELTLAPGGRLVVIPSAGHIVQDWVNPPAGRDQVTRFLLESPPVG